MLAHLNDAKLALKRLDPLIRNCNIDKGTGAGDVVFSGKREMKIFSMVFRDFEKTMFEKRYFHH